MSRQLLGVPRVRTRVARTDAGDEPRPDAVGASQSGDAWTTTEVDVQSWVDRVKESIPVEVVVAWAAVEALIGRGPAGPDFYPWLIGLMAVVTAGHMWVDVETPTRRMADRLGVPFAYLKHSQYAHVGLAVGGFLVWAVYLAWLYKRQIAVGWETAAKVLLPLYVVVGPQLVPNVIRKLHGVDVPDEQELPVAPTDDPDT